MGFLVAGDRCYLRAARDLLVPGTLGEMFGHDGGYPAPSALVAAGG
jgi:hypothetical protein